MINIIVEISAYIIIAILLGYFFGWLITKLLLKKRYQKNLDEVTLANSIKDKLIRSLRTKLALLEERQGKIENKYEKEIDAFMFERIDTTQKYKDLLDKFNLLK